MLFIPSYRPLQPGANAAEQVRYTEVSSAHEHLRQFIYCYWSLQCELPLSDVFPYRVVADGCIDVFFDSRNHSESFIMGFSEKHAIIPLVGPFNYTGIRFLPGMLPYIFSTSADSFSNCALSLRDVAAPLARYLSGLPEKLSFTEITARLDAFFSNTIFSNNRPADGRFLEALQLIYRYAGAVKIERQLKTGLSERQLRRLFTRYIGDSPKTFSRIVRFQHFLRAMQTARAPERNLFYDYGYYDQAHFIREFSSLYGDTPSRVAKATLSDFYND